MKRGAAWRRPLLVAALGLALSTASHATPLALQPRAKSEGCPVLRETNDAPVREVVPGARYVASGFHTLLFGDDYRELWATTVRVPVLDVRSYDGGLVPLGEGGGRQSLSLKLVSKGGQEYRFRSVDKDPTKLLPRALRGSVAGDILQDQTAASLPAASLVVGPLLDRVGVLNARTRLMVLSDDEALGESRKQFGGILGTFEPVPEGGREPTPGFEKVERVLSSEKLFELQAQRPGERIDARAFLKARLVDLLIGDWDRHEGQWRWGRSRESALWLPIPRDRDQAFARFQGLALDLARAWAPRLVVFSARYPRIEALVWNSRDLDRRLLSSLSWEDWQAAIAGVQQALDGGAIGEAVCRLPPEHFALVGEELAAALEARRRALPAAAEAFYRLLSRKVDVFATEAQDHVRVERQRDGMVRVRVSLADEREPWFDRLFVPRETREVRLYLDDGDDSVVSSGAGSSRIRVRVIGGAGLDTLDDSAGGALRFYDADEHSSVVEGRGTKVDTRVWNPPDADEETRPLDWGGRTAPVPWLNYYADVGALVGAGVQHTSFGFRQYPYAHQQTLRVGYATVAGAWRGEYIGDFRRRGALEPRGEIVAFASGFEVLRFYGFGNDSSSEGPDDRYKVNQQQYLLAPAVVLPVPRGGLTVGPVLRYSQTQLEPGQLVSELRPYGIGGFGQVGARGSLRIDLRDRPEAARKGMLFTLGGTFYPAVWTVHRPYGDARVTASTYVPLPHDGSLALRAGGRKVWGLYPFHEAAFIGSWDTVRGLPQHRYAGDSSLFGNAELRLPLRGVNLFFEGRLGLFLLADAGRVFYEGAPSDAWHHGLGGGAWLSFEKGTRIFSAAVASSEGHVGFYLHGGMLF